VTSAADIQALKVTGCSQPKAAELDAQELLGRRVDVVTEASLQPALRERILSSAVPL
jgi:predicted nucleotidyltransferase